MAAVLQTPQAESDLSFAWQARSPQHHAGRVRRLTSSFDPVVYEQPEVAPLLLRPNRGDG